VALAPLPPHLPRRHLTLAFTRGRAAARLEVVERKVRAAGKSKNGACTVTCSLQRGGGKR